MFHYGDMMCCSHCFVEMIPLLVDDYGNIIAYICPNCMNIVNTTDKL